MGKIVVLVIIVGRYLPFYTQHLVFCSLINIRSSVHDSGTFNLQANTDKIQHLLQLCGGFTTAIVEGMA